MFLRYSSHTYHFSLQFTWFMAQTSHRNGSLAKQVNVLQLSFVFLIFTYTSIFLKQVCILRKFCARIVCDKFKEIFMGESVAAAILLSRMEQSYYTSGFFVSKPVMQAWVAFLTWTKSRVHVGYLAVNHVTIMRAARVEWLHQIRRYKNSLPFVTADMAAAPQR